LPPFFFFRGIFSGAGGPTASHGNYLPPEGIGGRGFPYIRMQHHPTEITMKIHTCIAGIVLATGLAACASYGGGPAPAMVAQDALTGSNGMTLYVFDKDPADGSKSVCNGPCASNWPPLFANEMDRANGHFSVLTRDDGKKQWAYRGKPLYHWVKDQKPGDRSGDGVNNVWHVAKP
jgi:predicted lipoprotein with Yx(FWY)xxD motif